MERDSKTEKEHNKKTRAVLTATLILVAVVVMVMINFFIDTISFTMKIGALEEEVMSYAREETGKLAEVSENLGNGSVVIFLSVCDGEERAEVICGTGDTAEAAWKEATEKARMLVQVKRLDPYWVKADIVNGAEEIDSSELPERVKESGYEKFFRLGVSFDRGFETAFLEQEMNACKMYDYKETFSLDKDMINLYRENRGEDPVEEIPEKLILFSAKGFFCNENGEVYELYDEGEEYGRRVMAEMDRKAAYDVVRSASEYLMKGQKKDGSFTYGYYPSFDNEIEYYNIIRHTGTAWSLICADKVTGDVRLKKAAEKAFDYMIKDSVEEPVENRAFVVTRNEDEVQLGGNALAVIALSEYMLEYEDGRDYTNLIAKLANGILYQQNPDDGEFYHVMSYPDYMPKEQQRMTAYDGEAAFALVRAYEITGEEAYLTGAEKAIGYMMENHYEQYGDHWVSYAAGEFVKYCTEEEYLKFALLNMTEKGKTVYQEKAASPLDLELFMASWEAGRYCLEQGYIPEYIEETDLDGCGETIRYLAWKELNNYFYPEYAMYMEAPGKIEGTFFSRESAYRTRMDDAQHAIGGYVQYYRLYDEIIG